MLSLEDLQEQEERLKKRLESAIVSVKKRKREKLQKRVAVLQKVTEEIEEGIERNKKYIAISVEEHMAIWPLLKGLDTLEQIQAGHRQENIAPVQQITIFLE